MAHILVHSDDVLSRQPNLVKKELERRWRARDCSIPDDDMKISSDEVQAPTPSSPNPDVRMDAEIEGTGITSSSVRIIATTNQKYYWLKMYVPPSSSPNSGVY